jgi:hypothetical protein
MLCSISMESRDTEFWERYAWLNWSNSLANDRVMIRCALLDPRFLILLDIAARFGVERLMEEWAALSEGLTGEREFSQVQNSTQRMLNHIMEGARRAQSGH